MSIRASMICFRSASWDQAKSIFDTIGKPCHPGRREAAIRDGFVNQRAPPGNRSAIVRETGGDRTMTRPCSRIAAGAASGRIISPDQASRIAALRRPG